VVSFIPALAFELSLTFQHLFMLDLNHV
jgi:hypothetical protein